MHFMRFLLIGKNNQRIKSVRYWIGSVIFDNLCGEAYLTSDQHPYI